MNWRNAARAVGSGLRVGDLLGATNGHHRAEGKHGLSQLTPRGLAREGVVLEHHVREGRFQRGLSLIAGLSALLGGLEVTYEHYRGSYSQRIMYSPVILSAALTGAGIAGAVSRRAARTALPICSVLLLADGTTGFIFHIRGIARKPGGWRIPVFNVIMGPPLFAPLLLAIGGYLGVIASLMRRADDPNPRLWPGLERLLPAEMPRPRHSWTALIPRGISKEGLVIEQHVREGRIQKQLAAATAASALLSGIEALYSHYRNNFNYGVQWTPILLTPAIMFGGIGAVWSPKIARTVLPAVSVLALADGGIGFLYHARGVARRPGGLKKPLYNIIYGPPIFAPLLFAASGFLGLLASLLRRGE